MPISFNQYLKDGKCAGLKSQEAYCLCNSKSVNQQGKSAGGKHECLNESVGC